MTGEQACHGQSAKQRREYKAFENGAAGEDRTQANGPGDCGLEDSRADLEAPRLPGTGIEFRKGMKDGLPICFGYFAVAFAFGIQAKAAGLSAFEAVLMSATNLTSAGQFAALGMIAGGASYWAMALSQLVINLRYCLMSCAISQKLRRDAMPIHRLTVAYGVTDEIFGLSVLRQGPLNPYYSYGMMSVAIPGWSLGTLCGVISGNLLPAGIISALGIAIYGMFIAVVVPVAKSDAVVRIVVICAMAASTICQTAPYLREISGGFRIILVTVLVAAVAAWVCPVKEEKDEQ